MFFPFFNSPKLSMAYTLLQKILASIRIIIRIRMKVLNLVA